ncbi:MAG: hypothetical protein A2017_04550 [Lentisphaerae bacterium GWF2_44_16]|nr:MAG: hypothetical protein A2017_04550 [Lentisphaerae bacterium GWF2_44_16]
MKMDKRDEWLKMPDEKFFQSCRLDFFKATGKGGQKRNKTSSAVRLIHQPSDISVTSSNSRSQSQNRSDALRKLKIQIALKFRSDNPLLEINPEMSITNPDYPLWVAHVFDILEISSFQLKDAAPKLGVSTSKLQKLLARDTAIWQEFTRRRGKPSDGDQRAISEEQGS